MVGEIHGPQCQLQDDFCVWTCNVVGFPIKVQQLGPRWYVLIISFITLSKVEY